MRNLPTHDDGTLQHYVWPGGYPIYYLDGDNAVLCPSCAEAARVDELLNFRPVAADINWEDEELECEHCNAIIESACGSTEEM